MDFKDLLFLLITPLLVDGLRKTVTETEGGFCVINWITREPEMEPYTFTQIENVVEYCGWRTCTRPRSVQKTAVRMVYRDKTNEKVECCPGYRKQIIREALFDCQPICVPACEGGHCASPGNCTCHEGFQHNSDNKCVPVCEPHCVNGACDEPGKCVCDDGYTQVNSSYCAPVCSSPCINGNCVKPDECACITGYIKAQDNPFVCTAKCDPECIHASCAGLNECNCHPGYVKENPSTPNVCSPHCTLECIKGSCTSPDKCTCDEGFHLGNETWNVCQPDCNCTNGYCLEPNNCICFDNYTLQEGDCEPICNDCINATCASPYVCECLEGFKAINETACAPECTECTNGICTEPEVCSCHPGYENDAGNCKPVCSSGCSNGICTAPNVCSCESNSEKIEDNLCFPVCGYNCTNCTETDCLTAIQTETILPQYDIESSPYLKIRLKTNCSELFNGNASCAENNCSGLPLECSAIKDGKDSWKLLCIWKEDALISNFTLERYLSIYEESLLDIFYTDHLNKTSSWRKTVDTTVLLPESLTEGEASCDLCSLSTDNGLYESHRMLLQLSPCKPGSSERLNIASGNFSSYIIAAAIIIGSIALLTTLVVVLRKGKMHQYLVHEDEQAMYTCTSDHSRL